MSHFDIGTIANVHQSLHEPLTMETLLAIEEKLDKQQPQLSAGDPSDQIFRALGVKSAESCDFMGLTGIPVKIDPRLPANVIRLEHPDGRQDLFLLCKDGKVRRIEIPSIDDERELLP
jgi:hypothetical protein